MASSGLGKGWLVLSSRTPQPDHWGWGGPGATYCIALGPDGKETPEVLQLFRASKQPKYTLYPYWLDVGERKRKKTWPHRFSAAASERFRPLGPDSAAEQRSSQEGGG